MTNNQSNVIPLFGEKLRKYSESEISDTFAIYKSDPDLFLLAATPRQFRIMAVIDRREAEQQKTEEKKLALLRHAVDMEKLAG